MTSSFQFDASVPPPCAPAVKVVNSSSSTSTVSSSSVAAASMLPELRALNDALLSGDANTSASIVPLLRRLANSAAAAADAADSTRDKSLPSDNRDADPDYRKGAAKDKITNLSRQTSASGSTTGHQINVNTPPPQPQTQHNQVASSQSEQKPLLTPSQQQQQHIKFSDSQLLLEDIPIPPTQPQQHTQISQSQQPPQIKLGGGRWSIKEIRRIQLPSTDGQRQSCSRPAPQIQQPHIQPAQRPDVPPVPPPGPQPNIQPVSQSHIQPVPQPGIPPATQPLIQPGVQPHIQAAPQPSLQPHIRPALQPGIQPHIQLAPQPNLQPHIQLGPQPHIHPDLQHVQQPSVQLASHQQPHIQPSSQFHQLCIRPDSNVKQTRIQPATQLQRMQLAAAKLATLQKQKRLLKQGAASSGETLRMAAQPSSFQQQHPCNTPVKPPQHPSNYPINEQEHRPYPLPLQGQPPNSAPIQEQDRINLPIQQHHPMNYHTSQLHPANHLSFQHPMLLNAAPQPHLVYGLGPQPGVDGIQVIERKRGYVAIEPRPPHAPRHLPAKQRRRFSQDPRSRLVVQQQQPGSREKQRRDKQQSRRANRQQQEYKQREFKRLWSQEHASTTSLPGDQNSLPPRPIVPEFGHSSTSPTVAESTPPMTKPGSAPTTVVVSLQSPHSAPFAAQAIPPTVRSPVGNVSLQFDVSLGESGPGSITPMVVTPRIPPARPPVWERPPAGLHEAEPTWHPVPPTPRWRAPLPPVDMRRVGSPWQLPQPPLCGPRAPFGFAHQPPP